jgi:hypothetical protein
MPAKQRGPPNHSFARLRGLETASLIQVKLTFVNDLERAMRLTISGAHLEGGGAMRTITVRMHAADLSRGMAAMREWLDRYRYKPAKFVYDQDGDAVLVSVEFANYREGEAFATRFDGQEPERSTARGWTS